MDYLILLLLTIIIIKYKSILIRITLLLFIYPIWILGLLKNGIYVPGQITAIGFDYYEKYLHVGYNWALLGYVILLVSLWNLRNKLFNFSLVSVEEKTRTIIVILTIIFALLFMPHAFFLSERRFHLFPFLSAGTIYNVLSIFLIISHKSIKRFSSFLHFLLLIFLILRGERVDQIAVFLSLFLFTGFENKIENKIGLKFIIPGIFLFIIVTSIGFIRVFGLKYFFDNISYLVGLSFYAQTTAVDVTHVYLSAVKYYFEMPINLEVMTNFPSSFVPGFPGSGAGSKTNYIIELNSVVPNYGGGLFYSELAMNLGLVGVVISILFFSLLIQIAFFKKTLINAIFGVCLLILSFRIQWYGMLYLIKPLYLSFLLFYMLFVLSRNNSLR